MCKSLKEIFVRKFKLRYCTRCRDNTEHYATNCVPCCRNRYNTQKSLRDVTPKKILARAKARADEKLLPFNIDESDCAIPTHCPALGIRFSLTTNSHSDKTNSPSLDRIDPARGYVKGNVVVISHLANLIKTYATPAQVRAVADWMDTVRPSFLEI